MVENCLKVASSNGSCFKLVNPDLILVGSQRNATRKLTMLGYFCKTKSKENKTHSQRKNTILCDRFELQVLFGPRGSRSQNGNTQVRKFGSREVAPLNTGKPKLRFQGDQRKPCPKADHPECPKDPSSNPKTGQASLTHKTSGMDETYGQHSPSTGAGKFVASV